MSSIVTLSNVSVRFRTYHQKSSGLKESVMRWIRPPGWYKKEAPKRTEFWGLKDINFSLEEGSRLGIIGRNGAGKSTLLKVISRIYRPTEGQVKVDGRIAPLIEIGAGFSPELTGRENIFLNGAILGIPKKELEKRTQDIIQFSELADFIDMPVKYYSTGMHMKLAFTIATEIPPDVLILDELYAGGDAAFIEKANERLQGFINKSRVLILVAHSMEYVKQLCNRVIVIDHGRIVADGDPTEMADRYLAYCHGDTNAFAN